MVTSLEFDHGDIYRDLAEIELAFQRMLRQIPREGLLLFCADNHAATLASHAFSSVESYGFSDDADWRGVQMEQDGLLDIWHGDLHWGSVCPTMAGKHNMSNTLAAVAVAATLGMPYESIAAAVADFPGVRRRMEVFLEHDGVTFIDDFAHHPTAIRETIEAACSRWPNRRIRAVFEPRSNTTVTKKFQKELEQAFLGAGEVLLGPIHRKEAIPEEERLDTGVLAAALRASGVPAKSYEELPSLVESLEQSIEKGDVILIMSNGAFGGIYATLRERFSG